MIIKKPVSKEKRIIIDLTGPEGNAYALLGNALNIHRQLTKMGIPVTDKNGVQVSEKEMTDRMKSSDYDNLVSTMDELLGKYIVFYN